MSINQQIAEHLNLISKYYSLIKDDPHNQYRAKNYEVAAENISMSKEPIISGKQAKDTIDGVGASIEKDIDDFLRTGKMNRLEELINKYGSLESIRASRAAARAGRAGRGKGKGKGKIPFNVFSSPQGLENTSSGEGTIAGSIESDGLTIPLIPSGTSVGSIYSGETSILSIPSGSIRSGSVIPSILSGPQIPPGNRGLNPLGSGPQIPPGPSPEEVFSRPRGLENTLNGIQTFSLTSGTLPTMIPTDSVLSEDNEYIHTLELLSSVYGIGPAAADFYYKQGVRTLEDLALQTTLTPAQQLGLTYYHHIKERIPRDEMDLFKQRIEQIWGLAPKESQLKPEQIGGFSSGRNLDWQIVGSYRRGSKDSGDIDIIVKNTTGNILPSDLIELLNRGGLMTAKLAAGPKKFLGLIQLDPQHLVRRIDVMSVNPEEYPFSLLHFTGSDQFNILYRSAANRKGWTINEYRLLDEATGQNITRKPNGQPILTEADILETLGLPYFPPEKRSISKAEIQPWLDWIEQQKIPKPTQMISNIPLSTPLLSTQAVQSTVPSPIILSPVRPISFAPISQTVSISQVTPSTPSLLTTGTIPMKGIPLGKLAPSSSTSASAISSVSPIKPITLLSPIQISSPIAVGIKPIEQPSLLSQSVLSIPSTQAPSTRVPFSQAPLTQVPFSQAPLTQAPTTQFPPQSASLVTPIILSPITMSRRRK